MSISNLALRSPIKRWSASLDIDGVSYDLVGAMPNRSLGFTQARGVCSVEVYELFDVESGAQATVTAKLVCDAGTFETVFFTGRLDARPISDNPLKYEVTLTDSLGRLSGKTGQEIVWSGRSFPDAVRDLLSAAGIGSDEVATIFDPGADYRLGPVDAIAIPKGTVVESMISQLMTFGGTGLFVLPDGSISVLDAPGIPKPPTDTTPTYAFGATETELGFVSSRRLLVGAESRIARFTAQGPKLSTRKVADATFTLSGISGQEVAETYPWLQTDACARKIAEREIIRRNRQATQVDVTCPLNPNLRPGDTVWFRQPELGYPERVLATVIGISSSGDEMTMQLAVDAQTPSGDITSVPAPSPSFTMRFEVQPVKLAGVIAPATLVECTDTSTDPSGFSIVGREWTATCSGSTLPEPETVSWSYDERKSAAQNPIPAPIFVFPTLEGATVTLAVESSSGEGSETTQPVVMPEGAVFTRVLSVAAGVMGWRVLTGAEGWRSFIRTASCTSVPTINDNGPLLAGFSDGAIYRTEDLLLSEPLQVGSLGAPVNCLWVNEGNPLDILAGAGTTLYRSTDGGTSWTPTATFSDVINYCENSPANPGEIRVCAGNALYLAMDGASFSGLLSGPEGSLCRKVGSAPWGHLAVFTNVASLAEAWAFEEGHTIDWSTVPAENMPVSLATVTPLQYEEGYLVADGGASDMIRDGLFSELGYLASQGVVNIYRVAKGESGFTATYCTQSLDPGPHKVVMAGGKAFSIDASEAHRIGYGQATDPLLPPQIILLPYGQTGAADYIWIYESELPGWRAVVPPLPSAPWAGIAISPVNANVWAIWAGSYGFITQNAGQSWVQIYIPTIPLPLGGIRSTVIQGIEFAQGTEWVASVSLWHRWGAGGNGQAYYMRGSGGAVLSVWTYGAGLVSPAPLGPFRLLKNLVRGANGEVAGHVSLVDNENHSGEATVAGHLSGGGLTLGPETPYALQTTNGPDTREGYAVWGQNVARTTDYRSVAPTPILAAGASVAVCRAGVLIGSRDGVAIVDDADTASPSVRVVVGGDIPVGPIRAGSRGRGAVAIELEPVSSQTRRRIYAYNGTQWTSVLVPDGVGEVCPVLAIAER